MKKKEKDNSKKMFYVFIGCMILSVIIIGATFAYFMANSQDANTVKGGTYTTNFSLSVSRVTTVDMAYGLVPMKNSEAPHAAEQLCYDDYGNAGCQIYKITISTESEDIFFIDGYVTTNTKEGVETRFSRVYPEEVTTPEEETKTIFRTNYTEDDFSDPEFNEPEFIKTGVRVSPEESSPNRDDDYNCLFVQDESIGGTSGSSKEIYVMIWVYDDGTNQDFMQGMELAYTGTVTFITAQGNEIKATFS